MAFRVTLENFIERARKIHGDKYNYDHVNLTDGMHSKVIIVCPVHGQFTQTPSQHLQGNGCKLCAYVKNAKRSSKTHEQFLTECVQKWGDTYDLSKIVYRGVKEKITVICKQHGAFQIKPSDFLNGHGCGKCGGTKKLTLEEFINKAKGVHEDKYDYSKVEYINSKTKICIICPKHGEFWQTPVRHLCGDRCPKCFKSFKKTKDTFINDARRTHGDKYDYSKVIYKGNKKYVTIICPEHGEFQQKPLYHIQGQGCPKCKESHLEREVRLFLEENNIDYIYQTNSSVLKYLGRQSLDFYIPKYNVVIECQGDQHFKPCSFGANLEGANKIFFLKRVFELDKSKYKKCVNNNLKIIYFFKDKSLITLYDFIKNFYENKIIINNVDEVKKHLIL